jgi:hypothetical protein
MHFLHLGVAVKLGDLRVFGFLKSGPCQGAAGPPFFWRMLITSPGCHCTLN